VRLHVLSDLHLERAPFAERTPDADVVILAGDVARGSAGVEWARRWAPGVPVLYIAGNHEFYGHSLPGLTHDLRQAAAGSSVRVLEDEATILSGVRFLACTLWSDFEFDGVERREDSMAMCGRVVNDYRQIEFDPEGRTLTPQDTRTIHLASRRWLAEQLAHPHHGPTVVITHHAPLIEGRPRSQLLRALAGAFASDVTELMGAERVALWIYGHTHRAADLELRGTRVFSNPRGYPNQPVDGFDPRGMIELTAGC
jgi:predicted phosphodiesterase